MKKKKIALIVIILVLAAVCIFPIPRRVNVTLQGAWLKVGDDGIVQEESGEVQLRGWYFGYLVRDNYDLLKGTLTITPCSLEGGDSLTFQFGKSYTFTNPDTKIRNSSLDRYSASRNEYVIAVLYDKNSYSELAYADEMSVDEGRIFVASSEENADLETVLTQELGITELDFFG